MNKLFLSRICLVSFVSTLVGCGGSGVGSDDFDRPVDSARASSGELDLTRYVAVGDSLTAGFSDGALYFTGQQNSLPNILAQQFARAGGGEFTQPLVSDNLGGLLLSGNPIPGFETRLVLAAGANPGDLAPIRQAGTITTEIGIPAVGPFNNVGVPGARSFHLVTPSYGDVMGLETATANPYFVRFASSPATSIITDAATQLPTFFSLWIGNNDILGYATSGGVGADSRDGYGLGSNDITDPATFAASYNAAVNGLLASGAKGVLVNLPAVTDIPFFTTVPFNAIPLDEATASAVNASYAAYNGGLAVAVANSLITQAEADQRTIRFAAGQNAVVIIDEDLSDITAIDAGLINLRQATADDLLLLPLSATLGTPRDPANPTTTAIGIASPLLDSEVLTAIEVEELEAARQAYNDVITTSAANPNLALYDVAADLADLNDGDGINYGTGTITSVFATGGAFSLDGVHPTARGYAVIANGIIDELNAGFNASLPRMDPATFPEIFFEFPDGFDFSP